ncbi:hypothetical protein V7S43_015792 [Phytophthora oleae]|uniref:Uncharacterized protein n=1 Tax=Phytophthora oleae TaxID=2107226 RepID=A0ABD3F168_9STRA
MDTRTGLSTQYSVVFFLRIRRAGAVHFVSVADDGVEGASVEGDSACVVATGAGVDGVPAEEESVEGDSFDDDVVDCWSVEGVVCSPLNELLPALDRVFIDDLPPPERGTQLTTRSTALVST